MNRLNENSNMEDTSPLLKAYGDGAVKYSQLQYRSSLQEGLNMQRAFKLQNLDILDTDSDYERSYENAGPHVAAKKKAIYRK